MRKLLLAIFLIIASFQLHAQTWEAGASVGGSAYMGDLNQQNPVKISGIYAGAFFQRNLNPYLSVKVNFAHGKIQGADSLSKTQQFRDRNLSFMTQLNELSVQGEFNFMKYTPGADFDHFTPYLYFGVGVVDYKPQATYLGSTYDLRPLMTEGQLKPYSSMAYVIPYGAGVKYNFSSSWNIMFNAGYRYVHTDYLDDVSTQYPDKSKFTNPLAAALADRSGERTGINIGTPGTQRGDFRGHDTYLFVGFTLSFTFLTANCYY